MKKVEIEYFEFSNDQPFDIDDKGIVYPSVEHFYQAQKTNDKDLQKRIANANTPAVAKQMGRRLPKELLRDDWNDIKIIVMRAALNVKFYRGTIYHNRLLDTNHKIINYNNDHDSFWGVCDCNACIKTPFYNNLGEMLMDIRLDWLYIYAIEQGM